MMNTIKGLVLISLLGAVHTCSAQKPIIHGTLQVTFPNAEWSETEPPRELREFFESGVSPMKLVLHAVSVKSKLRFHATRFNYVSTNDIDIIIAGYLDGVRKRCVRQAAGEVTETPGNLPGNGFPVYTFTAKAPGDVFFQVTTIFCADGLYSLEINGPEGSRSEATQCLDGVSVVGEPGLPYALFQRALQVRANVTGRSAAFKMGRRLGYAAGILFTASLVVLAFVLAFRRKPAAKNSPSALAKGLESPPPLPSTAGTPTIPRKGKL